MELNQKLDTQKLKKLKTVTDNAPVYCIPIDITKEGVFTESTECFIKERDFGTCY